MENALNPLESHNQHENTGEHIPTDFYDCTYFLTRHGDAFYQINKTVGGSENPEGAIDPKEQDYVTDLTPEAQAKAREKARDLLSHLDPRRDILYFVASNLVRARETGYIYLQVAEEMEFTILDTRPATEKAQAIEEHKTGTDIRNALGENKIRTLESLSLNIDNMLIDWIFHPVNLLHPTDGRTYINHPENVSPTTRLLWDKAREIIEKDNKGTWGENWLAHSEEVGQLFENYEQEHPEEETPSIIKARDLYVRNFRNILREMKITKGKVFEYETQHPNNRVRVLAFTHENPLIYFLDKEYGQKGIEKLESVGFDIVKDPEGNTHFYASKQPKDNTLGEVKEIDFPEKE